MKKHAIFPIFAALLALCLFCLCAAPAFAQTPEERVLEARRAYAEAQEAIAQGRGEPLAKNEITLNATYMLPGSGQTNRKVELFFRTPETDENGRLKTPALYMARESFNVAARKFYREYLYDAAGEPLFCFARHDTYDQGTVERRYYYKNRQTVSAAPAGDGTEWLPRFDRIRALFQEYMALQGEDE